MFGTRIYEKTEQTYPILKQSPHQLIINNFKHYVLPVDFRWPFYILETQDIYQLIYHFWWTVTHRKCWITDLEHLFEGGFGGFDLHGLVSCFEMW